MAFSQFLLKRPHAWSAFKMTNIAGVLALVVAVTTSLGCNKPTVVTTDDGLLVLGEFVETSSLQRGVSVGSRTLVVESQSGAVTLTGTNSAEASLLFTITARGNSRDAALQQIDKLVIEEAGDEASYTYKIIPDKDELTTINIEGKIPRDASLRLSLRSGDITLTNVEGTIEVRQENGSIVYLGGSESLDLATLNGDVFADFYRLTSGSRVNLNVANGDLALGLPATANVTIDARTRAGSISVHDLRVNEKQLSRKGAGAVFKGKLGTGAANALLKTSNGSITFTGVTLSAAPFDDVVAPTADSLVILNPADSLGTPDTETEIQTDSTKTPMAVDSTVAATVDVDPTSNESGN